MIESEPYPRTLDAVVRYEERERATRQWCRKATRTNDASSRTAAVALGLDDDALVGGKATLPAAKRFPISPKV